MTAVPPAKRSRRSRFTSLALTVTLALAAVVFHRPLFAWFTGTSTGGAGAPATAPASASAEGPRLVPIAYAPAAIDPLRAAMDGADRVRALLAHDELDGVTDNARTVTEALRAAAQALPKARPELSDFSVRAASDAEHLAAAGSLADARKSFAQLNRDFIPLLGVDARLTSGWRVFECPMFEHAPWMQRTEVAANPFMGTKMISCGNPSTWQPPAPSPTTGSAVGDIDHYTCSMHPSVEEQAPGKCPICGMALVPVTKAQREQGVVMIDEARRQLIGVRTGAVVAGPMRDHFRAVGRVAYDESTLTDVNLKVRGWITHLGVTKTGERVVRGQTLFTMYSPELYNAQQDFLLATRSAGAYAIATPDAGSLGSGRGDALGRAAKQRLLLLGMDEAQVDAVAKKGTPMESVPFSSPASGFVIEKNVVDGASVEAGMRLFRIAALDKVWIEAEVYESDLARVRVGQGVTVTLDYLPGHTYEARVAYVYPYLDTKTRTGSVRIELPNTALDLRPGMYANVELASDLGNRIQVPASAVVYTGPRRLVFVDLGQGSFKPQEIRVGASANGMYEVLSGLASGDRVAISGAFLIAAEARISTAAAYWEAGQTDPEEASKSGMDPQRPKGKP